MSRNLSRKREITQEDSIGLPVLTSLPLLPSEEILMLGSSHHKNEKKYNEEMERVNDDSQYIQENIEPHFSSNTTSNIDRNKVAPITKNIVDEPEWFQQFTEEQISEGEEDTETKWYNTNELHSLSIHSHPHLPRIFDATSTSILYNRSVIQDLERTLQRSTQHKAQVLRAAKEAVRKEYLEEFEEEEEEYSRLEEESVKHHKIKTKNVEKTTQETLTLLAQLEINSKLNLCDRYTKYNARNSNGKENCKKKYKNDNNNSSNARAVECDEAETVTPMFANLHVEPLTIANLQRRYGECDVYYIIQHKTRSVMSILSIPSETSLQHETSAESAPHKTTKNTNYINGEQKVTLCNVATIQTLRKQSKYDEKEKELSEVKSITKKKNNLFTITNSQPITVKYKNADHNMKCTLHTPWHNKINRQNHNECSARGYKVNEFSNTSSTNRLLNEKEISCVPKCTWNTEKFKFHAIRQWCDRTELYTQSTCGMKNGNVITKGDVNSYNNNSYEEDLGIVEAEAIDPERAAEADMLRLLAEEVEANTNRAIERKRLERVDCCFRALGKEEEEEKEQQQRREEEEQQKCNQKSNNEYNLKNVTLPMSEQRLHKNWEYKEKIHLPKLITTRAANENTEFASRYDNEMTINRCKGKLNDIVTDAWLTHELHPWKDINLCSFNSKLTERKQKKESENLMSNLSCCLSRCEFELLKLLTLIANSEKIWERYSKSMQSNELQMRESSQSSKSQRNGNISTYRNHKWCKLSLSLTFVSASYPFDTTTICVQVAKLLDITPVVLLETWPRITTAQLAFDADNEFVLRKKFDEWQKALHTLKCDALRNTNKDGVNDCCAVNFALQSNCNTLIKATSNEELSEFALINVMECMNVEVQRIQEMERHYVELIAEHERCGNESNGDASTAPTLLLASTCNKAVNILESRSDVEETVTNVRSSNVTEHNTLCRFPHAPLESTRRRYPVDMRHLYIIASLCKEENEKQLMPQLQTLKAELHSTITLLENLCTNRNENTSKDSQINYSIDKRSITFDSEHTSRQWQRICQMWTFADKYMQVLRKVWEKEMTIIRYNSHVNSYNQFTREEQPLWASLYKSSLLLSYALCLYLHRHGIEELPEKYFVLLPYVARFLNCIGGHREMRLKLPQLLIEINEHAKNVRLHLDHVLEFYVIADKEMSNVEKSDILLNELINTIDRVSAEECTSYIHNENIVDKIDESNGTCKSSALANIHSNSNVVGRFICCLATEDDVVATFMHPIQMSSNRLANIVCD